MDASLTNLTSQFVRAMDVREALRTTAHVDIIDLETKKHKEDYKEIERLKREDNKGDWARLCRSFK